MTTSGGIAGMTGYDVQSTVILELVLDGFRGISENLRFRPEGQDDLEVRWVDSTSGQARHRFHQIKKATDNDPDAVWSLADVARVLLGDAVTKLQGNIDEQVWLLGDRLADDVEQLLAAGGNAPTQQRLHYLKVLHRLTKADVGVTTNVDDTRLKSRLDQWNPISQHVDIVQDISQVANDFATLAAGLPRAKIDNYRGRLSALDAILPEILARITARSYHGTEQQIAARVRALLVTRYQLDPVAVQDVIFRNLRGFINDVSKEPGRTFTVEDFETELVQVWPWLVVPTQPRILDVDHVSRPELVRTLLAPTLAREIVGPSGSGKSSLASEVHAALTVEHRDAAVLFVEVRTRTALRDVLVGVAHSLRRRGIGNIIGPALDLRASDTQTIERVAAAFEALPREIYLLIDCADSEVGNEFRRDLAVFARALLGTNLHLLVFAQRSVFRDLTTIERGALAVAQQSMPGLHFGEFLQLIWQRHPNLDRSAVHTLFEQLSAGLASGVLPNLAQQLARSRSLVEMLAIVNRPADERLSAAHRDRFDSIPGPLQNAASRVVCLSLPLPASELIKLFADDPMPRAFYALVEEGLLPPYPDRVEMHETVRAGLESLVAPALAKETHEALASYFGARDLLPAQIHHLEKAGRSDEARGLARDRFLSGHDWSDLVDYVGSRKCLTADEVITLLLAGDSRERYLLRDLLPRVKASDTAIRLFDVLRSDPKRYREDYQLTSHLEESLLKCDSGMLTPLVAFAFQQPDPDGSGVGWVRTSAWRARVEPDARFVEWFRLQALEVQKKAVGFLLLKPDLSRLTEALAFMHKHGLSIAARGSHAFGLPILDLTRDEEIEQFFEALPSIEPAKILTARSALLAPFEAYVWHERAALGRVGREILRRRAASEAVLANAVRVLSFLNDREVLPLSRALRHGSGPAASLAWMAPVLLDGVEELPELESLAVAPHTDPNARAMAICVATYLGADTDELLARIAAVKPDAIPGLQVLVLLQATFVPFPGAVSLLSRALDESLEHHHIFSATLTRLAESDFPGTEALLVKALKSAGLVRVALTALTRTRFPGAFASILDIARDADHEDVRATAIAAAIASGPESTGPLMEVWAHTPTAAHWRWVLAGRVRDASEASELVALALDHTQDWKIRRIAILAAGRLPFEAAIAVIAPTILNTPVSLADESIRFQTHALLAGMLEAVGAQSLLPPFLRGRGAFVQLLGSIYDEWLGELLDKTNVWPGTDAMGWLWDRLEGHHFASDPAAFVKVANELHVPMLHAAVFQVLRRLHRRGDLFEALQRAPTNWHRIRALLELCIGEPLSIKDEQRAQIVIDAAPPSLQLVLNRVFAERPRRQRETTSQPSSGAPVPTASARMSFDQVQVFRQSTGRADAKPVVVDVNERELRALVVELDPAKDTEWRPARAETPARLSLSDTSWRLRGGPAMEQASPHYDQRAALRPAVAAANRFGIDIPWHRAALAGPLRKVYADRFFASLGAQNDSEVFVRVLTEQADLLVPLLDEPGRVGSVLHLMDERLLPILDRFVQAGHGVFFQQLCRLLATVQTGAVQRSLTKAFRRWLVLLDELQASPDRANTDRAEWRVVWQTLSLLRQHPRFDFIPQARYRLLDVLNRHTQLWYGHRENILELLADWPPAYVQFEIEACRQAVFEHYRQSKLERYDDVADTLFRSIDRA